MIRNFIIAAFVLACLGCQQTTTDSATHSGNTNGNAIDGGDVVEMNDLTRPMIGRWGQDGEVSLIIAEAEGQVRFSAPENDTWRMEITDAKIVKSTVTFTQKNYLHDGTDHPFNGVACNSTAKLVDNDTLELGMTSENLPEYGADMLERMK